MKVLDKVVQLPFILVMPIEGGAVVYQSEADLQKESEFFNLDPNDPNCAGVYDIDSVADLTDHGIEIEEE